MGQRGAEPAASGRRIADDLKCGAAGPGGQTVSAGGRRNRGSECVARRFRSQTAGRRQMRAENSLLPRLGDWAFCGATGPTAKHAYIYVMNFYLMGPLPSRALGRRTRRPGPEPGLFLAPPPPKRCRACHAAGEHPSRATPAQTSAMPPRAPALPGCPGHEQGLSRRRLAARRWGTPRRHRAVHGCGGRGRTEVEMTCGSHMSVYDNVQSA